MIDTRRLLLLKHVYVPNDFFTEIAMTQKFVMGGTERGVVRLWSRSGAQRLDFRTDGCVHSVSIRDSVVLAASSKYVYVWQLDKHGTPQGPDSYSLNPQDDILWACFNPFERQPGTAPYLVGKYGCKPQWERAHRPMILKAYSAKERECVLSTTGRLGRWAKIRDLESQRILRNIRLKAEPHMIWTNRESLFVVYRGSRTVEMTPLQVEHGSITDRSAYLESVSLHQLEGP